MLRFHAWYAAGAAVVLGPSLLREPALYSSGLAVVFLVLVWHAALAAATHTAQRTLLHEQWRFVAILSLFLVVPDWFLADVLGTLHFPEDGAWRIGGRVSVYMAGMWSIPLSWVLVAFPPRCAAADPPSLSQLLGAALMALVIFGAAEQLTTPLNLWLATDSVRHCVGHVALYVLPAEAILGAATLHAQRTTAQLSGWEGCVRRILAAGAVAFLYLGALAASFLFVEGGVNRTFAGTVDRTG